MQSWRGLIARKQVFAGEPFEILGLHCRSCSERGTMCLPAHGAMAIQRPSQRSIGAGLDALGQWRRRNPSCLATLIDPPHGEVSNKKQGERADGAGHQMADEDARDPQRTL